MGRESIDGNLAINAGDNHALIVLDDERVLRASLAGRIQPSYGPELTPENIVLFKDETGEVIAGAYFESVPEGYDVKRFITSRRDMILARGYCPIITPVKERDYGFLFTKQNFGGND